MTLGELIAELEKFRPETYVGYGLCNPHSYRGYYDELAFEPAATTVGEMLQMARGALGATYQGWKGGQFQMGANTPCHIAVEGCTGEPLTRTALAFMLDFRTLDPELAEGWERP
jgi:hypothetical protein